MFVVVIGSSDEVETQKQLGALNAACRAFGDYLRIECDAPEDLEKFTKELAISYNGKVVK